MQNETTLPATGSKKNEWIFWIILLIPFLYIPFIWNRLPETIPVHWNFHGVPDNYSSKISGTLFVPVLNIIIYVLMLVLPKIDPRKRNYSAFSSSYRNIRLTFALFFMILFFIIMQWSMGDTTVDSKTIFLLMFGLFAVLGNLMRTIRSNFFFGIRTPWTLDNPDVWRKTHEQGGKIWFYASILAIGISFFLNLELMLWLAIPYFCLITVYPVLYSYLLFRKIGKTKMGD